MDKLTLAHDWAMKHGSAMTHKTVIDAWAYADAMQAEADERNKAEAEQKHKEMRELLNADNTFVEREGQHFDDVNWQPDWSQAPEWANWWSITKHGQGHWFLSEPKVIDESWVRATRECKQAPSFDYQGNWKESLRERPHGK